MPTPKKDETKEEFLSRCMNYPDMQKYGPKQRYAICVSMWDNKKKKKK